MDVARVQWPAPISAESLAGFTVNFDRDANLKACGFEAEVETTGTGIETKNRGRAHCHTLDETSYRVKS